MSLKLNSSEKCETISIVIDKNQHPIAWKNKVESLINSGLTQDEAENELIKFPTMEMELYYDVELGAFLVESAAVENTEIYNPYSGEEMEFEGNEE